MLLAADPAFNLHALFQILLLFFGVQLGIRECCVHAKQVTEFNLKKNEIY